MDEYQRVKGACLLIEKALLFIIILRIVSGSIDITAAMLMFKFNDLEKAFYINTLLALVGPSIVSYTTYIIYCIKRAWYLLQALYVYIKVLRMCLL